MWSLSVWGLCLGLGSIVEASAGVGWSYAVIRYTWQFYCQVDSLVAIHPAEMLN